MRGKPLPESMRPATDRIIPAHAGQTGLRHLNDDGHEDHPRACGANELVAFGVAGDDGSSPRMRGKRSDYARTHDSYRIIPAHAGQTVLLILAIMISPDHPRACGANGESDCHQYGGHGSSPRMRGKLVGLAVKYGVGRIIPAHAGQTTPRYSVAIACPDHPRACGANLRKFVVESVADGSSPRMRGKRDAEERRVYR